MTNPNWVKKVDKSIDSLQNEQANLNAKLVAIGAILKEIKVLREKSNDGLKNIMEANEKLSDESGERKQILADIKELTRKTKEKIQQHIEEEHSAEVPEDKEPEP